MGNSGIGAMAKRLRWGIWIVWAIIVLAYVAGRLGLSLGSLRAQAHAPAVGGESLLVLADASVALLTVALFHLSRMLGAVAAGDLFTARVVRSFRAFAMWLLLLALTWILAPIAAELLRGPGPEHELNFSLQLRDVLTLGITLILFLVARLLERARAIDEENREIV